MIISKAHNFGFIHIPKCAGSTIRQQLRDLDDAGGKFYHTMTVEGLGFINGNHVPLKVLAQYFPEDFAALQGVTSYAITREPLDRFVSSVAQALRRDGVEPGDLSPAQLLEKAGEIMDDLSRHAGRLETRHTIFFPQIDYVDLDGVRMIDHIFPMERIDQLFGRLEAVHGLTLERDQVWNPTVTYRMPAMRGPLNRLKDAARARLPVKTYGLLRDLGVRAFTTKGVPKLTDTLRGAEAVNSFVETFYREDIRLYSELTQQNGAA